MTLPILYSTSRNLHRSASLLHPTFKYIAFRGKSTSTASQTPRVVRTRNSDITISWPDGSESTILNIWLRDHCPSNYHEITKQRMVDTASIPLDIQPISIKETQDALVLEWPASSLAHKTQSHFQWSWLKRHNPPISRKIKEQHKIIPLGKTLWTAEIAKSPPTVDYNDIMESDKGVLKWLRFINEFGFSFVKNVPPNPVDTQKLIERIAFIRPTHYGGFWDFTADLAHGDTAYTDIALRAHTDTTYFSDPAGLQLFHLLSPRSTHTGGHSLLVDGFRAAQELYDNYPSYYRLFSTLPIQTHASGGPTTLIKPSIARPVFEHDTLDDKLKIVRWNNDDRDILSLPSSLRNEQNWEDTDKSVLQIFYEALHKWEEILRSPQSEYWTSLEPGQALIFDNHRVLHGRSSFSGKRRLCGAYINGDDWLSRLRTLERENQQ